MTDTLVKLWGLLEPDQRRSAVTLLGLMLIGMVLETLGIGLFIPVLAAVSDPATASRHIGRLAPWANSLSAAQLTAAAMALLVGVALIKAVFLGWLTWRQTNFAFGVETRLSRRLFAGYLRQPYTFHLQRNSAILIRNVISGAGQFAGTITAGNMLISELLVLIGILALLLIAEPLGTVVVGGILGVASVGYFMLVKDRTLRWGEARQHHEGQRLMRVSQGLGGVRDVKILGREAEFVDLYEVHNASTASVGRLQNLVIGLPRLWLELLAVLGLAILVLTMLAQGKEPQTVVPSVGLFAAAAFRLMPSLNKFLNGVQNLRYNLPVIDLLYDERYILNAATDADTDAAGPAAPPLPFAEGLEIRHVTFAYPEAKEPVLHDVSLRIGRGQSVGFIGPSGAGKSTLINIVLGLLKPAGGAVLADGIDIHAEAARWQRNIGYVPQSVYLVDDTLRRNIAFGLPDALIDEQALARAVSAAQLSGFIAGLPEGLDTLVGERGVRLSGGQCQRIGIARALYHDPSVLVLDEASSALDTETEEAVMAAITALRGKKTVLIIAHRLTTVAGCDALFEVANGRVIEAVPQQVLRAAAPG